MMIVPGSDSTISLMRFIETLAAHGCATAHSVSGTVIATATIGRDRGR